MSNNACEIREATPVCHKEITNYIDTLDEEISNMGSELEALRDRLGPICAKLPEGPAGVDPEAPSRTSMGGVLAGLIDTVRVNTEMVRNVLATLEI